MSFCVERSILKKTERSDSILRHSAVQHSIFCGSLFSPSCKLYEQEANHVKFHIRCQRTEALECGIGNAECGCKRNYRIETLLDFGPGDLGYLLGKLSDLIP